MKFYKISGLFCFLFLFLFLNHTFADHGRGYGHGRGKHQKEHGEPVNNEAYKQECGACHFAYQPWLLPSGSWKQILAGLPSHFGDEVQLKQESKIIIGEYLQTNAAENSPGKRANKICKQLKGRTVLRITEMPYIQKKHHELGADIFTRKSIGSFSNCAACHTTAEQGDYNDYFVRIPK